MNQYLIDKSSHKFVDLLLRFSFKLRSTFSKSKYNYEQLLSLYYSEKQRNRHKKLLLNSQYNDLDKLNPKKHKTSNKLFILGSGLSINELTNEQWNEINQNDSIGFNYFLIKDFKPTYYVLEPSQDKQFYDFFWEVYNSKNDDFFNIPLIIQYYHYLDKQYDLKNSNANNENIYFSVPRRISTTSKFLVSKYIKKLYLKNRFKLSETIHHGGSLSHVLSIATLLGYEEIILLGIDLNSPKYFFQTTPYISDKAKTLSNMCEEYFKGKEIHNTANKAETFKYNELPVTEIIDIFNKEIYIPNNISLKVGTKNSLLYPTLPLYEFKK